MRILVRSWLRAILCLTALGGSGRLLACAADLDQLMSTLAQHRHGHVSFQERKFIALLEKPVESSGELIYDAPDHLEKRTLTPKPESLVLTGGIVTAQRGRHTRVIDLKQYPQIVPFIESIRATLAGDRPALERVFELNFDGDLTHWVLNLTPRDAKLAATVRHIRIEGEEDLIHSVEILQGDGDRSVMTVGSNILP